MDACEGNAEGSRRRRTLELLLRAAIPWLTIEVGHPDGAGQILSKPDKQPKLIVFIQTCLGGNRLLQRTLREDLLKPRQEAEG